MDNNNEGKGHRMLPPLPRAASRSPELRPNLRSLRDSPLRASPPPRELSPFADQEDFKTFEPLSNLAPSTPSRNSRMSPLSANPGTPTRLPLLRFDTHEDTHAHGSPFGSPVRRANNLEDDDSIVDFDKLTASLGSTASRPLPTSPFDDVYSFQSQRTLSGEQELTKEQDLESNADFENDEDYDGRSIASAYTLSEEGEYSSGSEPPQRQPRRNRVMGTKQVQLVKGNLVLDCPVPTKLYSFLPRRDSDEFVHMRYSACTANPDNFADAGFTIRPAIYERDTEICVCITMYNEDEILFTRTLHAVFKNIAYLCQRKRSKVWGPEGWKKIVVTILADGRTKVNPRILDCLAAMGIFQDGIAKNLVNGAEVKAHIFEYTAQVSLTPDMRFQGAEKQIVPVQMIFCLKEKNAKKINSHRWLFNAICPQISPNVVVLLDVGTRPTASTLYHLWKAFDEDSNVAGACGEIKSMTGKFGKSLLNPLVAAQNFEYKMSNILDKPLESVFGYISVLPGALSAYRYRALQNGPDGTGPLASYFKGEKIDTMNAGIFEKNMYLAEDRILCWELVAKRNEKWVLKYVKGAQGETDVPETLAEFISQRRRWLNGALYAAIYSQTHCKQILATAHSPLRKFFLFVEFIYQFFQLLFTFFSIANLYLAFYFVGGSVAGSSAAAINNGGGLALFLIFKYLFIVTICAQFVLSLGNRPQGSRHLFAACVIILASVTAYVTVIGIYFVIKTFGVAQAGSDTPQYTLITMVVALASTYGIYTLMSILYLDPWHIFTSAIQYFLLLPGYICTLQIYAFCNTHDVTWGTKGDNEQLLDLGVAVVKSEGGKDVVEMEMPSQQVDIDTGYENALHNLREKPPTPEAAPSVSTQQMDYFREIRTRVVLVWMTGNLLLAMLVTQFFSLDSPGKNVYLQVILWSTAVFAAFRALGSFVFLIQQMVRGLHKTHHHISEKCRSIGKRTQNNCGEI